MSHVVKAEPFRLKGALAGRLSWVEYLMEKVSGLDYLSQLYKTLPPAEGCDEFLQQVITLFGFRSEVVARELERIPREGGAVLVANHPFGGVEGVLLAEVLRRIRPDVKLMANGLLQRIPELAELFIGVDPFGGQTATRTNSRPLREAVRWVRGGGLLVIFPAGEVSHFDLQRLRVTDPLWSPTIARIIRMAGAPVIPTFVHGQNGAPFQLLGMLHPRVRTFMLVREFINKENRAIHFSFGQPIPFSKLEAIDSDEALMCQLRLRSYALGDKARTAAAALAKGGTSVDGEPLAEAAPASLLAAEVAALPAGQCLERSGGMAVYYAKAAQVPWLMQEIGRLRELTFRATGEGTGRSRDIDLYDAYYLHLFVWQEEKQELVGAYRLGLADDIVAKFGKRGLYTQSLFRYRRRLLDELNPAIELGRSFVRPEYQRSYSPLLMLWKGIGAFIAAHPRYRILFGPVSISNEYATLSQQLLVDFLKGNSFLPQLARMVKPRRPFRGAKRRHFHAEEYRVVKDLEGISELVASIEEDNKGVPILLRQYLKMGGKLLGFNVDPDFNDALDGLIMVDLRNTEPKVLARYMGKAEAEAFIAYHQSQQALREAS